MRHTLFPALLSLLLTACGSLVDFGPDRTPSAVYRLGSGSGASAGGQAVGVLIGLDEPAASEALRGQGIAVSLENGEIRYLPRADWVDRVPRLVARYLGTRISGAEGFTLLARPGSDIPLDYRLKVDIQDFSIHPASSGGGDVAVSLTVLLVGLGPSEVIARRTFTRTARIPDVAAGPAVGAFEAALAGIAADMEDWLAGNASAQRVRRGALPN